MRVASEMRRAPPKIVFFQWGNGDKDDAPKKLSKDTENEANKEKLRAIEAAADFVGPFDTHFLVQSGLALEQWLLPVLVPIPALVNAAVDPDVDSANV
eukprot:gene36841-44691_t